MSLYISDRYGEIPQNEEDAYLSYASMRDELMENSDIPINTVSSVVDSIRRGFMPDRGAVVSLGAGVCGGFDLVAVERVTAKEAVIIPAKKSVVHGITDRIIGQSVLAFTNDNGEVKLPGHVEDYNGFNVAGRSRTRIGDKVLVEHGVSTRYQILEDDSGVLICRSAVSMPRFYPMS